MPRGRRLTEREKGKIDILRSQKCSNRQIAKKIRRSETVIRNYARLNDNYGVKPIGGQKSKIVGVLKKRIIHLASSESMSASQIKQELALPQSIRTIQRVLSKCPSLIYKKFKSRPHLTAAHKSARTAFAQSSIKDRLDWSKIVWSDEKKFNLDGPDGIRYYWHDLRKDQNYLSKRAFGGGSLMIWGAFVNDSLFDLHIIEGNYDAERYTDMLRERLVPFMQPNWTFMHDGASIHRAKHTNKWLKEQKVPFLEWPANSPDLNPIENLWGLLTRAVFANGRQFKTKDELKAEVIKQWDSISADMLNKLNESMPNRIIDVISRKGSNTDY